MPTSVVFGLIGLTTFAAMLAFVAWAAALLVELRSLRRAVLRLGATLRAGPVSDKPARARAPHAEDERPTLPDPLPSVRPGVIASVIADASDEDDQEVTRVARRPREIAIDEPRARPTILPPPSSS